MPKPDPTSAFHLSRLQVEALFRHDEAGRITITNEPDPDTAPRLFLGRTLGGDVWRIRDDIPADVAAELERLLARDDPITTLDAVPTVPVELMTVLARSAPITAVFAGPAWYVPPDFTPALRATLLTTDHLPALRVHFPSMSEHLGGLAPSAGVVENGVVVSVCSSVRITSQVCEAGLHTVEGARGRGYGPDAVAAWAGAVRSSGRTPLYGTSWDNAASRRVAEKLGLVQYAVSVAIE